GRELTGDLQVGQRGVADVCVAEQLGVVLDRRRRVAGGADERIPERLVPTLANAMKTGHVSLLDLYVGFAETPRNCGWRSDGRVSSRRLPQLPGPGESPVVPGRLVFYSKPLARPSIVQVRAAIRSRGRRCPGTGCRRRRS